MDKDILLNLNDNMSIIDALVESNLNKKNFLVHLRSLLNYGLNENRKKEVIQFLNKEVNSYNIECNEVYHFIAISDTHFGHQKDRIDLIDNVYEYAVRNNISDIIHTGDFLEGIYLGRPSKHKDIISQAIYVNNKYPMHKGINNRILLGNHDYSALINHNFEIDKFFERSDFIFLDYGISDLIVNKEIIKLRHRIKKYDISSGLKARIHLHGHSHTFKMDYSNKLVVNVPTISDVSSSALEQQKGFLDIEITFNKEEAEIINIKYISLDRSKKNTEKVISMKRILKNY